MIKSIKNGNDIWYKIIINRNDNNNKNNNDK